MLYRLNLVKGRCLNWYKHLVRRLAIGQPLWPSDSLPQYFPFKIPSFCYYINHNNNSLSSMCRSLEGKMTSIHPLILLDKLIRNNAFDLSFHRISHYRILPSPPEFFVISKCHLTTDSLDVNGTCEISFRHSYITPINTGSRALKLSWNYSSSTYYRSWNASNNRC